MVQQQGHNFAIVDEIDSILIDEARPPHHFRPAPTLPPNIANSSLQHLVLFGDNETFALQLLKDAQTLLDQDKKKRPLSSFTKSLKAPLKTNS